MNGFFLLVGRRVYLEVIQALKLVRWRGEGKCVVKGQEGEWKEEKERGGKISDFKTLRTTCQFCHSVGLCPKEAKVKSAAQLCA